MAYRRRYKRRIPRWKRSYHAHLRLAPRGSYDKYIYHLQCAKRTKQVKRKLTKREKKAFWNSRMMFR